MKDTAVMKLQAHVIVTVHDFWNRAAIFLRSLLFKIYFIVVVVTTTKIGSTCTFYIIPLEFFFFSMERDLRSHSKGFESALQTKLLRGSDVVFASERFNQQQKKKKNGKSSSK